MRILQLCNKPPYPPLDGGSKAMHNITQGLLDAGHQVKVLCISTAKQVRTQQKAAQLVHDRRQHLSGLLWR